MRLEELINAMLCECMRINANVRDYAIFYWPFCSSRIESHEAVRQDVCCTGTGKPAPVQHRPLLTYGSTASCSARLTVAAATKEPRAPNGVISHSCWYGPFSIYLCAISCLFLLVAACMMNMFSEVPSDILPVVVGLVGRLIYQIQFWSDPGKDGDGRHPVVIVCDEAHLYLPSSAASTGPLEKRALENYERIAKEGRKYGVGLMVVSQRPSDVSTTILSQCSNIISLRLANKTDQSVVKQLLPESLEGLMEVLPTLDVGEAVVVGDATLLPTRIKMSKPKHEPRSATIPFWTRWDKPKADVDLIAAVENMRRQSRTND